MKMTKRYSVMAIALMMMMTGCGKVEEKSEPAAKPDNEMNREVTVNACTSEYPTDEETTAEEEVTTSEENGFCEEYVNEILGGGEFGFEMYDDGHIADCWEHRMEAAPILLEAAANASADDTVDTEYSIEQFNGFETSGFMTHIKFEDAKPFIVGDTIIEGNTLAAAGEDGEYFFWVEYFDENGELVSSPYYTFDESYKDRMTEVMNSTAAEPEYVTGSVDVSAEGDELVTAAYNGEYPIKDMDSKKIVEIALEALNDPETQAHTLDQMISEEWTMECIESGLDIEIILTTGLDGLNDINTFDASSVSSQIIQICGKDGKYSIAVNNGSEMELSSDYAERLIHEGLNR